MLKSEVDCADAGLPKTAHATALESAAAKRRGFLMGLQPVESVLARTRRHPYLRRSLRIVLGQLYLIFRVVSISAYFGVGLPFWMIVSPSVEVMRTVPPLICTPV